MARLVLPVEILDEIIRLLPKKAQLALCRTSHLFLTLTIRYLYADVSLDSTSSLVQLCSTLRSNLMAAACVKRLLISYTPTEPPNTVYLASFYRIVNNALRNLSNLQGLRLLVVDPCLTRVFFSTSTEPLWFPSLNHFETYLPLTPSLIIFLNRHLSLAYLEVSHYEDFSHNAIVANTPKCSLFLPPRLALPKLHHYVGNSAYLTCLTPAYPLPLRSAHLVWDAIQEVQGPIASLAQASSHSLNVLTCRRRGWNTDLIGHISVQLPDIYALQIVNVLVVDAHLPQTFLDEVTHYLTHFRRLQRLKIKRQTLWCPSELKYDLDHELTIATEWGAACPSLLIIALPHSETIEWRRIADNIWVPIDISSGKVSQSETTGICHIHS